MSTPKEPNFFSDNEEYARGIKWYENLYAGAENGAICGESSTHYSKLPTYPETISRIQKHAPDAKFIYVVRHPIDRLISHYIHEWTMNVIQCDINTALDEHPELIEYSLYHKQIMPFIETFGRETILLTYFQQIINKPQQVLEEICAHARYPETPTWVFDEKPKNVSSERIRQFPLYDMLVNSKISTVLRRTLVPQSYRDMVKNKYIMSSRPKFSDENLIKLEKIFDEDLKLFSAIVGIELNCANFNTRTLEI